MLEVFTLIAIIGQKDGLCQRALGLVSYGEMPETVHFGQGRLYRRVQRMGRTEVFPTCCNQGLWIQPYAVEEV